MQVQHCVRLYIPPLPPPLSSLHSQSQTHSHCFSFQIQILNSQNPNAYGVPGEAKVKDRSRERRLRVSDSPPPYSDITSFSPQEIRDILQPFPQRHLIDLLQDAALRHVDVLFAIRSVADSDITLRQLFIRCLSEETTTDALSRVFSPFGPIEDAVVITDKTTGKSKGYGFVTFKHIEDTVSALKKPTKRIDGRMTVTQLAASGQSNRDSEVWKRKIFVGNIHFETSSDTLLNHFMRYGEVEEGPIAYYKENGKRKGIAFFVYKTEEGAKASLREPLKIIDGHQIHCMLAVLGKKGNTPPPRPTTASASVVSGDGMSGQKKQQQQQSPHMIAPQYGGYGGGGFRGRPTLHASPMMASQFGNSGGGGVGIGGSFGDYGARFPPPPSSAIGMAATARGFQDGTARQQSMPIPKLLPRWMFQSSLPYL